MNSGSFLNWTPVLGARSPSMKGRGRTVKVGEGSSSLATTVWCSLPWSASAPITARYASLGTSAK